LNGLEAALVSRPLFVQEWHDTDIKGEKVFDFRAFLPPLKMDVDAREIKKLERLIAIGDDTELKTAPGSKPSEGLLDETQVGQIGGSAGPPDNKRRFRLVDGLFQGIPIDVDAGRD
jgi:hypothetical protein